MPANYPPACVIYLPVACRSSASGRSIGSPLPSLRPTAPSPRLVGARHRTTSCLLLSGSSVGQSITQLAALPSQNGWQIEHKVRMCVTGCGHISIQICDVFCLLLLPDADRAGTQRLVSRRRPPATRGSHEAPACDGDWPSSRLRMRPSGVRPLGYIDLRPAPLP